MRGSVTGKCKGKLFFIQIPILDRQVIQYADIQLITYIINI